MRGDREPRTIVSTLFFGTSCTLENCGVGEKLAMGAVDEDLNKAVELAQNGGHLTPNQQNRLSDAFRMVEGISVAQFREKFKEMDKYIRENRDKINIQFGGHSFSYLLDDSEIRVPGEKIG
jgi:hypothetical protein